MSRKLFFKFLIWFNGILLGFIFLITISVFLFKDDICGIVIEEINQKLKSRVSVSSVELSFWGSFPNLSVDFNDVFIQDSYQNSRLHDTLLYSQRIRLKFNPIDVYRENYIVKSLEISEGAIKMKVNPDGQNNYDIFKEDTTKVHNSTFQLSLEIVEFQDFRFDYINSSTNQEYRTNLNFMNLKGDFSNSFYTVSAESDLHIFAVRSGNMTLVKNQPARIKMAVEVNTESNTINFPKSKILISKLPFLFFGNVSHDGFKFNLHSKDISIQDVVNNFTISQLDELKKNTGEGIVFFNLIISGDHNENHPINFHCDFGINNGLIKNPNNGLIISKIKLQGLYTNFGGSKTEMLELKNISFKTKSGPFKANLKITQFKNPLYTGNINGKIDLANIGPFLGLKNVELLKGNIDLATDFIFRSSFSNSGIMNYDIQKLRGDLTIKNVQFSLVDDERLFESINGRVYLRDDDVGFDNVSLNVSDSDIKLNGVCRNIVEFFGGEGNLNLDLEILADEINIENLYSSTSSFSESNRTFILPEKIFGEVFLDVGLLRHKKHFFQRLKGKCNISKRRIDFPNISFKNSDANILGSIKIQENIPEMFTISGKISSQNINFNTLFKEWDNFNQNVVKSNNIEGIVKASIIFEAPFDMRSGIIFNAIDSRIGLEVNRGRLKNVKIFDDVIQSINSSNFKILLGKENISLFKKKLKYLKFNQLKNTIIIKDGIINIPSMSVASSALDIEISGQHTFENKVDYRFGFRFRDLKQNNYSEFGDIIDDGSGIRLFMRMYGEIEKPIIEWDRESRKKMSKEKLESEKKDVKSILRTEFGLYKNDTTVKPYIENNSIKEELIIEFDPTNELDSIKEKPKQKKNKKIFKILDKWKKESEIESEKENFIIDN